MKYVELNHNFGIFLKGIFEYNPLLAKTEQ